LIKFEFLITFIRVETRRVVKKIAVIIANFTIFKNFIASEREREREIKRLFAF